MLAAAISKKIASTMASFVMMTVDGGSFRVGLLLCPLLNIGRREMRLRWRFVRSSQICQQWPQISNEERGK